MQAGRPSETALRAARARARHQIIDKPVVLDDPLALRMLGPQEAAAIRSADSAGTFIERTLRGGLVARSLIAEDALADSLRQGVRQYVVLGAGLDTWACRQSDPPAGLRVFEVDHPDTQRWKRQLLAEAAIVEPGHLRFAPADFERQTLGDALAAAGFDAGQPAFFSWLGVTMYLPRTAVMATLRYVASLPAPTRIAFDCIYRPAPLNLPGHLMLRALSRRYARMGEPWHIYFSRHHLADDLRAIGLPWVETLSTAEMGRRVFPARRDGLRVNGGALAGMVLAGV